MSGLLNVKHVKKSNSFAFDKRQIYLRSTSQAHRLVEIIIDQNNKQIVIYRMRNELSKTGNEMFHSKNTITHFML